MEGDDVASALRRIATGSPVNGTVEIGGPEKFRFDELVRQILSAHMDPRVVVTDPQACYYGVDLTETALVPDDDAQLGQTRFGTWLAQSAEKEAAVSR